MTTATLDPIFDSSFIKEMVRQTRALDTYGALNGTAPDKILAPYVLTKETKGGIPIIGNPDEKTLARVQSFYNAIAVLIEQ